MICSRYFALYLSFSIIVGAVVFSVPAALADPASSVPTDLPTALDALTQQDVKTLVSQYPRSAVIRYALSNNISARAVTNALNPGINARFQGGGGGSVGRPGAGGGAPAGALKEKIQVIKGALPTLQKIGPGGVGPTFIGGVAPRFDFTGDGLVSMDIPRQVVARMRGQERSLKAIVNAGVDRIIGLHQVEVAETIEIADDGTVSIGGRKQDLTTTQTAARDWVAVKNAGDLADLQFPNSGNEALW